MSAPTDTGFRTKSETRRAALTPFERYAQDTTGRDARGRFVPMWAGSTCDRIGCDDRIEQRGSRFCAVHRREHGLDLLAQLEAMRWGAR